MASPLDLYRKYLADTGQTDDRPDRFLIEDIGGYLQNTQPELLKAFPDFDAEYQRIREANSPGTMGGLVNTAKTAFQRTQQALQTVGGIDESDAASIAEKERQTAERRSSVPWENWQRASGSEAAKVFLKDPVEILSNIVTSGFAGSIPSIAGGLAGGAAGMALGPVGSLVGAGAGAGSGSLAVEYGGKYLDVLREAGVDLTDAEAIVNSLQDEGLRTRARDLGLRRGLPVAAFDAISAGLGGKFLAGAHGATAKAALKEAALQGALGGAGEAAGALAAGEDVRPKAVFEEVVGELGPGVAEVGSGVLRRRMAERALGATPAAPRPPIATPPAAVAPAAPVPSVATPPVVQVSPARRIAGMSPEQQVARLEALIARPTRTPEEEQEMTLLQAIVGEVAKPAAATVPPGATEANVKSVVGTASPAETLGVTDVPVPPPAPITPISQPSAPTPDAFQIPSPATLDVRQPPADGEAMGVGNAVVQEAPQTGASQEKRVQVQEAIKIPGVTYQFSVFDPLPGKPPVVQVDVIAPDKSNSLTSTSPELLRELGVAIPEIPATLPMGQYSLEQIQAAAAPAVGGPSESPITRAQALALVGGQKNLLPNPGQSIRQPQDTTGRFLLKRTDDGKFFTVEVPRETIDISKDPMIGANAAGESIYQRPDGSYYRMRFDRPDKAAGYPDFGGDLFPVSPPVAAAPLGQQELKFATMAPQSYSRLIRAVEDSKQGKATGSQWKATIQNSKSGINRDEFALARVEDLEDGKSYTKQEVLDYLRANEVKVEDVTLGNGEPVFIDDSPTQTALQARIQGDDQLVDASGKLKPGLSIFQRENGGWNLRDTKNNIGTAPFEQYQLPGGKEGSYREVLLTVPDSVIQPVPTERPHWEVAEDIRKLLGRDFVRGIDEIRRTAIGAPADSIDANLRSAAEEALSKAGRRDLLEEYKRSLTDGNSRVDRGWVDGHSQYSDIANPIVRLRYNERQTAEGQRILFLEEVQAPQKGQFEKMPALFQKNWRELAFKWALKKAADEGYDAVGWTTGEQQAARYDLSKQVNEIVVTRHSAPEGVDAYDIEVTRPGNRARDMVANAVPLSQVESYVGKDVATKVAAGFSENGGQGEVKLSGLDLKVGGEGLKRLYDSDFRNVVNSLPVVKKAGVKVGSGAIADDGRAETWTARDVSEQARLRDTWVLENEHGAFMNARDGGPPTRNFKDAKLFDRQTAQEEAAALSSASGQQIHLLPIPQNLREALASPQPRFAEETPNPQAVASVEGDRTNELMIAAARLEQAGAKVDVFLKSFLQQSLETELQARIDRLTDRYAAADENAQPAIQAQIEKLQAQLSSVDRIRGVTYSPYHIAVGLSDIQQANVADLSVLLHEGAHALLAQDPAMRDRVIKATNAAFTELQAQLAERQKATGLTEQINGDPEELIVSTLSQKLAQEGVPEASSLAQALWTWVKDLFYRLAMGMQEAFGREPSSQIALDWFENQLRRVVSGHLDWRFAHLFARMRPEPISTTARKYTPAADSTPGGVTNFFDPLQGVVQPRMVPTSTEAIEWNRRFAMQEPRPSQTQTEAFKKWFRSSAVKDENGEPVVVYHGTPTAYGIGNFDVFDSQAARRAFDRPPGMDQVGSWFSSKPGRDGAERYAGSSTEGRSAIYPVYLSIQRPFLMSFPEFLELGQKVGGWKKGAPAGRFDGAKVREYLQERGWDGILFDENNIDGGNHDVWVAFEPTQIKSATGNRGTFDPTNPDIRFATVAPSVGADLDIPHTEAMARIEGAALNNLSTVADALHAKARAADPSLSFDQWWAMVNGGETPKQLLQALASVPGADTAQIGGERMTKAMNDLAAVQAKVLVKDWLAKAVASDARAGEVTARAEGQLISTAEAVNKVEAELRDATMHEATLREKLKDDIATLVKAFRRGLDTTFKQGELAQAVRDAEELAEGDPLPAEYQKVFERVLADEVPLFDYVDAIAKLDLDLAGMTTPEIRQAIEDNAEGNETLSTLTEPRNRPLLVALSALVKRNAEQVDLLQLRRADQKQFLAIFADLKRIREATTAQLAEMEKTIRKDRKATTFADRLKRSFVEKRARLRELSKRIREADERRTALTGARAGLQEELTRIEAEHLPHYSEWTAAQGAKYLAMYQDEDGRWRSKEKTLQFTKEGPAVNPEELLSDLVQNREYLRSPANAEKRGTETYQRVERQTNQIAALDVQQKYYESRRLWFEKWFMDPGSLLLTGGGPAAARATQMMKRFQSIAFRNWSTELELPSLEWSNRLGDLAKSVGMDARTFLSQIYDPVISKVEAEPGLEEGPALREAVRAARRRLPEGVDASFDEQFKDFLRRTKALSETFVKIAEDNGLFIEDDRLGGELRRAVARGWLTVIRRMDASTVSTILSDMDKAGWRVEFSDGSTGTFDEAIKPDAGGKIVRSATFDALTPDGTEGDEAKIAVLENPEALNQAISGFFPQGVIDRWLQPFVMKPGEPVFSYDGNDIDALDVQQAWVDAGGAAKRDIVGWIDRLGERIGIEPEMTEDGDAEGPSPEAKFRLSMLRQLGNLYKMEARMAADANQVKNLFDSEGRPAHLLMDSRENDLLPPEHIQHMAFTPRDSQMMLSTLAFHAAFGRNGEAMTQAINEIEGNLKARLNAYQSLNARHATKAAKVQGAKALGYDWDELKHAAKVYRQVEAGKETLRAAFGFGNQAGPLGDVRGLLELLHFTASQTTNNPKTGLLNMLQPSQRAIARRSMGPVVIRDTARAYKEITKQFFGGFLETFGLHLLRASQHAKEVGAVQGQAMGNASWAEVLGRGTRMGVRGEEMAPPIKAMRSLQALQKKGLRIGTGEAREFLRQGNLPFFSNIMRYMGEVAANANAVSEATSLESMTKAAADYFADHPEDAADPTFRLTAKDLSAYDKAWFFDQGSFDYYQRKLVEYDIGTLESLGREAGKRLEQGQPILDKSQVAKVAVMTGNELDLQGSINTNPAVWASNPILKFATPLIGWPIRQMGQVHDAMRDVDGRASVMSALTTLGILASWSLPIGLAFTFLTDEYDDKLLKKKANMGNLDPISGIPVLGPAAALMTADDQLEAVRSMAMRLSRAGNIYGLGADYVSTLLNGLDPTSGQRQFSLDSRILAFSQLQNLRDTLGNWINSGYATTFANLERPLLMSIGGSGALHAVDIANGVLGIDNQEARITKRINASQWLRSAGREAGLEIRRAGGASANITPMGAWTREMALAALGNDRDEFRRAYLRAVEAARVDGREDPEQAVLESFKSRSPIEVFRTQPTDQQLREALALMSPSGRQAVTEALRLFEQYEQFISPSEFRVRMDRLRSQQRAAQTRAMGGADVRRRLAESALAR